MGQQAGTKFPLTTCLTHAPKAIWALPVQQKRLLKKLSAQEWIIALPTLYHQCGKNNTVTNHAGGLLVLHTLALNRL